MVHERGLYYVLDLVTDFQYNEKYCEFLGKSLLESKNITQEQYDYIIEKEDYIRFLDIFVMIRVKNFTNNEKDTKAKKRWHHLAQLAKPFIRKYSKTLNFISDEIIVKSKSYNVAGTTDGYELYEIILDAYTYIGSNPGIERLFKLNVPLVPIIDSSEVSQVERVLRYNYPSKLESWQHLNTDNDKWQFVAWRMYQYELITFREFLNVSVKKYTRNTVLQFILNNINKNDIVDLSLRTAICEYSSDIKIYKLIKFVSNIDIAVEYKAIQI